MEKNLQRFQKLTNSEGGKGGKDKGGPLALLKIYTENGRCVCTRA